MHYIAEHNKSARPIKWKYAGPRQRIGVPDTATSSGAGNRAAPRRSAEIEAEPRFGIPEVEDVSRTVSPSAGRRYGLALVCRVWEIARSSVYSVRTRLASPAPEARKRGPKTKWTDAELAYQLDQRLQVLDAEHGAPLSQGDDGVDLDYISPASRQRTYPLASSLSVEDAVFAPGVGVTDQLQLLAGQRVVGMDDSKTFINVPITRSRKRFPRGWSRTSAAMPSGTWRRC
jgi:hypothetical protein